jgi:uncharacterized protein
MGFKVGFRWGAADNAASQKLEFDHMKFQPDTADGVNVITRVEAARLWIGNTAFDHSILVPWKGGVERWDAGAPTELTPPHFEQLLALKPELVIFGSGDKLRFISPATYRALIEARIGIETMDTAAACRTYNVLASEGRSVVAALLLGPG